MKKNSCKITAFQLSTFGTALTVKQVLLNIICLNERTNELAQNENSASPKKQDLSN